MNIIRRNKALYLALLGFFIVLLVVLLLLGFKRFLIFDYTGSESTKTSYETVNIAYQVSELCGGVDNCTRDEQIDFGEKSIDIYFSKNGQYNSLKIETLEFSGSDFEIMEFGVLASEYFVILVKTDILTTYYYNINSMSLFKSIANLSSNYHVLDKNYEYYDCRTSEGDNNILDTYNVIIDSLGNISQNYVESKSSSCSIRN